MSTSTGISVAAIERELASIWRDEATSEDAAVTRARVLTLLVYDGGAGDGLDETLFTVTEAHPARALVMTVEPGDGEPSVSASVTAACRVQGPRSKQVCCEQVTFRARGAVADALPSAMAQLLAPDVPVFLWWRAAPDLNGYVFKHLVPMADRVIIDSSYATDPRRDMTALAEALRSHPEWTAVTDFTWQRIVPWREMMASFYDMPDHRPYLDRVDTVTVEYSPKPGQVDIPPRAMLLASWLAERLGWQLDAGASSDDGDNNHFVFRAGERTVSMRFAAVDREGMDGLITTVTLGISGEPGTSFSVRRAERRRLASEIVVDGKAHASRVLAYSAKNEAELLGGELGILGHDSLYEAAVAVAAQIGAVKEQ